MSQSGQISAKTAPRMLDTRFDAQSSHRTLTKTPAEPARRTENAAAKAQAELILVLLDIRHLPGFSRLFARIIVRLS